MIAIVDYDAGNMLSVAKALRHLGQEPEITRDPDVLIKADSVILPGVGAFGDAMEKLNGFGLVQVISDIIKSGKPFLGICLGLQLLYEGSEEAPGVAGIGALDGRIRKIPVGEYKKIPHMGWNSLRFPNKGRLYSGIDEGAYVYFVHSYYLEAADRSGVTATCEYNVTIDASVEYKNVFACQFHPEKSGDIGLKILDNFVRL
ncbi:MAG: imidazole glycerol phosphate synthase subunit HisH [Lachnospiraceae bacterium]|nr:imidazole glycerol phosphate synthase subunit HisH [Lachnospiraceae bacterium]